MLAGDVELPALVFDFAIACPQLTEKPGVLDCDDRLVGEGLEERGLGRRELARFRADADSPDGLSVPEHRSHEQ